MPDWFQELCRNHFDSALVGQIAIGLQKEKKEEGLALAEQMGGQPSAIFARHRRGRNAFFSGIGPRPK